MKIRFASALLALALPLCAQEPTAQAENLFYKAFYLERGPRDFAAAMTLYEQFLAAAPDHKLATEAAKQQFALLGKTGKTKEQDAFKEKYGKLLGNVVAVGPADARRATARVAALVPVTPRAANARVAVLAPVAARIREAQAARIAELEKQLAKAKAEGNEEEAKRLATQIERTKAGPGRGAGGVGGPGGGAGGRGMGGGLFGTKKLAEMTAEELTTFKDGVANMESTLDRMRERMTEEQVKKFETNLEALKKGLADSKLEDAQKALDALRESLPQRRRGGEGAGAGAGGTPPAGGTAGGRGGNNGGGGGTNRGGGGGR